MADGRIPLPERPGLGIELNPEALARYEVDHEN
jgi:L-alanine-DL-glutamate epimerase-like enolase superfamily enzyme